jgi:urease accessory protein
MTWHSSLSLDYTLEHTAGRQRTLARFVHSGPLRILKSLYPEGDTICHNVLVHPPGGLTAGDVLDIRISVAPGAHGLATTPSATRFYRSDGEPALQRTQVQVQAGARFEWLPLETIAHPGCIAHNHLSLDLAPGAEMMGWDVTSLGLPHSGQAFDKGSYLQHIEMPGTWLERGRVDASDLRLRTSPLGLAGHSCMATLFFAAGSPLARSRRDLVLEQARGILQAGPLQASAGATSPNPRVVAVRVLAPQVEPAMNLLRQVWADWRAALWGLQGAAPRIWAM